MPDFTPVPTGFVFELEDGIDKVSFIDPASSFQLLDGTLSISGPSANESVYDAAQTGRQQYVSRVYESREIKFSFRCTANTYDGVVSQMNRVIAMIERSQSGNAMSGGFFGGKIGYTSSYQDSPYVRTAETGSQGLVLRMRLGLQDSATPVYTIENGQTIAKTDIVSYSVFFGDWEWADTFSANSIQKKSESLYILDGMSLTLTCDAYAVGDSRVVVAPITTGLTAHPYPVGATTNTVNKVIVTAAQAIGSAPALTRITTRTDGANGIILSRDGKYSVWNAPSIATNTRTGAILREVLPVGYSTDVGKKIEIQITQLNPAVFRSRVNGGTWTSTTTPSVYTRYSVGMGTGADDIGVVFTTTNLSGSLIQVNDILSFANHQLPIAPTSNSFNLLSNAAGLIGNNGVAVCAFYVNVPARTSNRYKVLIPIGLTASFDGIEGRVSIRNLSPNSGTGSSYTSWFPFPPDNGFWLADMGTLDFTPSGRPSSGNPGSHAIIEMTLYLRTSLLVTSALTATIRPMYLVAVSDANSYLIAKWGIDELNSYEVFSNFDPARPYMAEISRSPSTIGAGLDTVISYDLDATYTGGYLTVIPGVDNTIMAVGLFSSAAYRDYRCCIDSTGATLDDFSVAIRPRFLFVGS